MLNQIVLMRSVNRLERIDMHRYTTFSCYIRGIWKTIAKHFQLHN
jgi:hypothetical protein